MIGRLHTEARLLMFLSLRKYRPDVQFAWNRAKVSFCSDGTDDRIKFLTFISGFTVSSCAERFLIQCFPFFDVFELQIDVQRFYLDF